MSLSIIENAHFIRPLWLAALPLCALIWFLLRKQSASQQWFKHIPKPMLAALQLDSGLNRSWWQKCIIAIWILAALAAAGPSWQKQAVPTFENANARIIILDLSPSMLAKDLSPDRLSLAKYKLIDILREQRDGQSALIAYAGDAYTVSPLSDDPKTIEALLPALHPSVMPSSGSNTEAAIALAQQLLNDAGLSRGEFVLITDGVAKDAITTLSKDLSSKVSLSILAVGGSEAAPIPTSQGGFLKKANGEIALANVNIDELRSFALSSGGKFARLSSDDSDVRLLLDSVATADSQTDNSEQQASEQEYDAWVDMGHWLILMCLPLVLVLFRKGLIYVLPLGVLIFLAESPTVIAQTQQPKEPASVEKTSSEARASAWSDFWLDDLWRTPDQQATERFNKGDYQEAAERFEKPEWAGVAHFKNGDYSAAIDQLAGSTSSRDLYNRANALAFNGQLKEAIDGYAKVLEREPEHQDAQHNKQVLEELLKQQEQQQNQQPQDSEQQDSGQQGSEQQDSEQQDSEQQNSQDQQSSSDQRQQDQSQNEEAKSSKNESSDEASTDQESEEEKEQQGTEESDSDTKAEDKQQAEQTAELSESDDEATESEESSSAVNVQTPLKDSSEQWLRGIQDDPSGLLRRKFNYQSQLKAQERARSRETDNAKSKQRY